MELHSIKHCFSTGINISNKDFHYFSLSNNENKLVHY